MQQLTVDILVIGWGKGGKTLAGALGRAGREVALVERSKDMYGGGCINIACVPTKALVHQAEARRDSDDPATWFAEAVAKRDTLIGKLRARNHEMLAEVETVTLIDGHAAFVGPHEVEVTGGAEVLRVTAETIVINTGTSPAEPEIPGIADSVHVYDSRTLQHIDPLPGRLTIVGAGFIGLEFAGMFARFGSEVTVINRSPTLLAHEDRDVAEAVEVSLAEIGVTFLHDTEVNSLADDNGLVTLSVTDGKEDRALTADAVMMATGRIPATADLGLDIAEIALDERGFVQVDDQLRTSVPGVFAVGDVNGGPQFTYISLDDHRIVLDQLAGSGKRSRNDRVAVPSTTFLTPPLARVGLNEAEAGDAGRTILVAGKKVADIAAMPRPKIVGETHGLIKFVVDADTDEILGATLFCVDAQELINLVALAMRAGVTAAQLRDGIWTHPSTTEALNEVLAGLRPQQS